MKNYIKQYKDFLNESTIETTWITSKDLLTYLDISGMAGKTVNVPLSNWLKGLNCYNLKSITQSMFSKHENIHTCLRLIKEVKFSKSETLYDMIKRLKDPRPIIAIRACDAYLKGEIGDKELEVAELDAADAADAADEPFVSSASAASLADIVYTTNCITAIQVDNRDILAQCKKIFVEELENFDWSRVEKEIRGQEIFGE